VGQPIRPLSFHRDMKSELVDQAALVITDPPILINLVSKRLRQLAAGRPALVERKPGMREADVALTEIIQGKIKVETIEDLELDVDAELA
jgi:DNA-directed RNA polymerase subunit omega